MDREGFSAGDGTGVEVHRAPGDVERDAGVREALHRVRQVGHHFAAHCGIADVQVTGRIHGIIHVEGHRVKVRRVVHPVVELAPDVRPHAVGVVGAVPGTENHAGLRHVHDVAAAEVHFVVLLVTEREHAVEQKLGAVVAVLVEDVLEPLPIEAGARQAVGAVDAILYLVDPEPRAQVLLAALVGADDLREALEGLGRVGEPVAVVRVLRVVIAADAWEVAGAEDARLWRVGVGAQVARRCRAIQRVDPRSEGERLRHEGVGAGDELRVGHVGHGRDVAVVGVPMAVRRDGVDPRQRQVAFDGLLELVDVARAPHLAVLF